MGQYFIWKLVENPSSQVIYILFSNLVTVKVLNVWNDRTMKGVLLSLQDETFISEQCTMSPDLNGWNRANKQIIFVVVYLKLFKILFR